MCVRQVQALLNAVPHLAALSPPHTHRHTHPQAPQQVELFTDKPLIKRQPKQRNRGNVGVKPYLTPCCRFAERVSSSNWLCLYFDSACNPALQLSGRLSLRSPESGVPGSNPKRTCDLRSALPLSCSSSGSPGALPGVGGGASRSSRSRSRSFPCGADSGFSSMSAPGDAFSPSAANLSA